MWVCGLDLGQAADFTAFSCIEILDGIYTVRHLQRFELGTPYPTLIAGVKQLVDRKPLKGARLAVDYTGVGKPVVDMMQVSGIPNVRPITITGGHDVVPIPGSFGFRVPKKELVSVTQMLLQERRLKIVPALKDAEVLRKELSNFKVKITAAANETFGAWRDGQHDDLVLSVALACWLVHHTGTGDVSGITLPGVGENNITETAPQGVF